MEVVAIGLLLSIVFLPLGGGMLSAVDSVKDKRRSQTMASSSVAIPIFGAILVVIGILFWVAFVVAIGSTVYGGAMDLFEAISSLNSMIFLSTIPLAGAFLCWIGGLIGQPRSSALDTRLDKLLGSVAAIGWLWVVLGIITLAFPFGLVPSAIVLIVIFVLKQRQAARQTELVWVLTIAAQKSLPLAPGVSAFANECRGPFARRVHQLAEFLNSGLSLPDALDRIPRILPDDAKLAIRIGWEAESLAQSLRDLAFTRTTRKPIWHLVAARLAYVVALWIVLQAVVGFVLYFIVPKFKKIFMDFGVVLPRSTIVMLQLSDLFVEYAPLLLLPAINCIVYLAILRCWISWRPRFLSRLVARVDTARILTALACNVEAGRPLTYGIGTLARWFPKWMIRRRLTDALTEINSGVSWSQSLSDQGLLRNAEVAVLESAERAGNLTWAMRELANAAERRLGYQLQLAIQILFPIVLLCFASVVFLFATGMFSPLVKLITELSG